MPYFYDYLSSFSHLQVTGLGYTVDGGVCVHNGEVVMGFSHVEFAKIIEVSAF